VDTVAVGLRHKHSEMLTDCNRVHTNIWPAPSIAHSANAVTLMLRRASERGPPA
jgi:hypothetical protein